MPKKNVFPYLAIFTGVLALILLAAIFLALNSVRVRDALLTAQTGFNGPQLSSSYQYDDPLITLVPTSQRSADTKTKVFVSSQDPILGTSTAKVYVILYGSLLDDTMQQYLAQAATIYDQYGDDVAIVWKDGVTGEAEQTASVIGHCANNYGRFWEYATALANRSSDDSAALQQIAIDQGVNATELQDCVDTSGMSAVVSQSTALAGPLGVSGSHSVFVNDNLYTDSLTNQELNDAIHATLETF